MAVPIQSCAPQLAMGFDDDGDQGVMGHSDSTHFRASTRLAARRCCTRPRAQRHEKRQDAVPHARPSLVRGVQYRGVHARTSGITTTYPYHCPFPNAACQWEARPTPPPYNSVLSACGPVAQEVRRPPPYEASRRATHPGHLRRHILVPPQPVSPYDAGLSCVERERPI